MKNKKLKILLFVILGIVIFAVLIYLDLINLITKLGLSPSLWISMVVGAFPIILTIVLWQKEKQERIEQLKEDSLFQKKLIIRSEYVSYFEELLEQLNELTIFLEVFILNDKTLTGKTDSQSNRIRSLIGAIILDDKKVWEINYRVYAFKAIDIDIFKYNYNNEEINLRAYMPYICLKNKINSIYKGEQLSVGLSGGYISELSEKDKKEVAKQIIEGSEMVKEFLDMVNYLKKDIEEKISFNI